MMLVTDQQGGPQAVPPIPKMDAGTPGAPTRAELRQQARELTQNQVRKAVREAVAQAQGAGRPAALPAAAQGNQPVLAGTTPPRAENPDVIPQQAVDISLAFFLTVAVCVIGFPLARAFARLLDRRAQRPVVSAPDVTPQLRQLQESVDALAIEMERISEGQRFASKLLAERSEVAKQG